MTSVLNVDTIADKAGTGPVALTKQEALKLWCHWTETTTSAIRQSMNVSSLTDGGTGRHTLTFVSNFSYNDYASCAGACGFGDGHNDTNAPVQMLLRDEVDPRTTGDIDLMSSARANGTGGIDDATYASHMIVGDLA